VTSEHFKKLGKRCAGTVAVERGYQIIFVPCSLRLPLDGVTPRPTNGRRYTTLSRLAVNRPAVTCLSQGMLYMFFNCMGHLVVGSDESGCDATAYIFPRH
jgi:hypothetical protein